MPASNPGIRGKVGANHRILSTYLNALTRHHLLVEQAAEPRPGTRDLARQHAAQPGAGPLPMYLVVACRKAWHQPPVRRGWPWRSYDAGRPEGGPMWP